MKNMFASLLHHGAITHPARTLGRPTVLRVIGCYAVAFLFVLALNAAMPLAERGAGRVWSGWAEGLTFHQGGPIAVPVWLDAFLAMAGAFLVTVPIVIVYARTRTHEVFDDSLANTVLVLPSIVTAILIVVSNSLAMAFSLAGIVAAVRFRIALKESRDALYIFAAVAVGFAAGIYALDVALMASIVFVLLEVLTWRTDLGAAPGSQTDAHREAKERDEGEERPGEAGAREQLLRVQVRNVDAGRRTVEPLLETLTKRWRNVGIGDGPGPAATIEYEVRLRKRYPAGELRSRLRRDGQPAVVAVELAPLEAQRTPSGG
jgi:hypothetical protein